MTATPVPPLDLEVGVPHDLGEREFTPLDLFLFSAAGWHPHRIHFDLPYAQREGHTDLVVHGPLQAVHLFQGLAELLPAGATIVRATYRHRAPLLVGTRVRLVAVVTAASVSDVELDLWVEDEHGQRTTTGVAVVRLAAD